MTATRFSGSGRQWTRLTNFNLNERSVGIYRPERLPVNRFFWGRRFALPEQAAGRPGDEGLARRTQVMYVRSFDLRASTGYPAGRIRRTVGAQGSGKIRRIELRDQEWQQK